MVAYLRQNLQSATVSGPYDMQTENVYNLLHN